MSIALIAVGLGLWLKYSIHSARLPEHFGGYVEPGFEAVEHAFRFVDLRVRLVQLTRLL